MYPIRCLYQVNNLLDITKQNKTNQRSKAMKEFSEHVVTKLEKMCIEIDILLCQSDAMTTDLQKKYEARIRFLHAKIERLVSQIMKDHGHED